MSTNFIPGAPAINQQGAVVPGTIPQPPVAQPGAYVPPVMPPQQPMQQPQQPMQQPQQPMQQPMQGSVANFQPAPAQAPANLATVAQATTLAVPTDLPDFLYAPTAAEAGTDLMKRYISPPRLKIVQSMTKQEIKDFYPESSVIIVPGNPDPIPVLPAIDRRQGMTEGFAIRVTPLFFYPEFLFTNPHGGGLQFVRDKSTDPNSPLAKRCRGPFEQRKVECKESPGKFCRFLESMNFVILIHGRDDIPLGRYIVPFISGGFKDGANWCKIFDLTPKIKMYSHVYDMNVAPRKNDKGNWFGWNVKPVAEEDGRRMFIRDLEFFTALEKAHNELKEYHSDGLIEVDYEDAAADENTIEVPATNVKF